MNPQRRVNGGMGGGGGYDYDNGGGHDRFDGGANRGGGYGGNRGKKRGGHHDGRYAPYEAFDFVSNSTIPISTTDRASPTTAAMPTTM